MVTFKKSDEGKQFYKEFGLALRRKRMTTAKFKYLQNMPKKPPGALAVFMKKNFSEVRKGNPTAKGFELKKMLTDKWQTLDADERKTLEQEGVARYKAYEKAMAEFKMSENWKNFVKMVKPTAKAK